MTEAGSSKRRFPRAAEVLAALLLLAAAGLLLRVGYRHYMRTMYPMAYTELVEACAAEYGFDPSLVYALIRTESDFNPDACSSADARGLMQMTDETFEWAQRRAGRTDLLSADQLYDPEISIRYGVYALSLMREKYTHIPTLLAAYNAGMGQVGQWLKESRYSDDGATLKEIPYKETRDYIDKVLDAQEMYRELYDLK